MLFYRGGDPNKPIVLVLSPSGVAAAIINGNTIYSGLIIPFKDKLVPLNHKNRAELRNKYSKVDLVIIGEVSMVSRKQMYQIHKRLNEIFSPSKDIPFGGKSMLICRNFNQLLPVQAKPFFKCDEAKTPEAFVILDPWLNLKLPKVDQIKY